MGGSDSLGCCWLRGQRQSLKCMEKHPSLWDVERWLTGQPGQLSVSTEGKTRHSRNRVHMTAPSLCLRGLVWSWE